MTAGARLFACMTRCVCALLPCVLGACYTDNPGDAPPRGTLYFPNSLALSREPAGVAPRFLFVGNSNFDLRYNAGSLQAYDLDAVAEHIDACDADDCRTIDTDEVLAGEVLIGSFCTSLAVSADGARVLVTTRTDPSLAFVAIDPDGEPLPDGRGVLRCADGGKSPCALADFGEDRHDHDAVWETAAADLLTPRRSTEPAMLQWPHEPSAVLGGALSDFDPALTLPEERDEYALVAHRTGPISLFVEQDDTYVLTDVLPSGASFASSLAFDPETRFAYAALDQFTTTASILSRVRVAVPEDGSRPELRAFVGEAGLVQILGGYPQPRDVAFLPAMSGESSALSTPSGLVVAGNPSTLLLTSLPTEDGAERPGTVDVKQVAVLGFGAARVASAVVDGVPLAVVSSFESREVAVVDLRSMRARSMRPNLSGPFDIEVDAERRLVYVTDFRSSVLRVIDLRPVLADDAAGSLEVIATIGKPRVIQELQ